MPKPPQAAQVREAIDTGRTGGKISFPDPAAVPLGTDEEAAGTPVSGESIARALLYEVRVPRRPVRGGHEPFFWPMALPLVLGAIVLTLFGEWLLRG